MYKSDFASVVSISKTEVFKLFQISVQSINKKLIQKAKTRLVKTIPILEIVFLL